MVADPIRVSVVIPALNEAEAIALVLRDLPRDLVTEIVVVDGGSTDGTPDIAAAAGARVLSERRRGYGRACRMGLHAVTDPDIVVFLDADYADRPAELAGLIDPIRTGAADMVIGSRLAGALQHGALPWHSRLGNRLAAWLMGLAFGVRLSDLGPFRAVRFDLVRTMTLLEDTYGWPVEMIARVARAGGRVVEVPVSYHPRIGTSKITGTVRGSIGAAWYIFTRIARYRVRT